MTGHPSLGEPREGANNEDFKAMGTDAALSRNNMILGERGAALVEFVLILPLLLVLLFGILDFGRAINYWIDSTHLANAAARWAVVNTNPGPGGSIEDSMRQQADSNELRNGGSTSVPNPIQVILCLPDGTSKVGDPVQADASVDYNWLSFLGLDAATTTLSASATMRIENDPTTDPDGAAYSAGAC
jgi:hypothetical protein